MRKQCLRILIALLSVAGSGMAARAQARDQIVVTIPFEFVVAGKTFPAGTYKVNRVTDTDPRTLILHSFEIVRARLFFRARSKAVSVTMSMLVSSELGANTSSTKLRLPTTYSRFQCPV